VNPVFEQVAEFDQPPLQPLARLVYVPADGNFYGTTTAGGAYGKGAIFRMTPGGGGATLVSFTGEGGLAKGEAPDTGLVLGNDGALYGTTLAGGTDDYGTVFKVTTGGQFTTLVEFTDNGAVKGSVPSELILGGDGNFYGLTQAGGASGLGTVFKMTSGGAVTTLVEFTGTSGNRLGSNPIGALAYSDGTLYGVTQFGGTLDLGTVFRVATNGSSFLSLVEFTGVTGAKPGSYPSAGVSVHPDGGIYGTTEGGAFDSTSVDLGTVFRVTPGGTFTLVKRLTEATGWAPAGSLCVAGDGTIYGTASSGGTESRGTVFKITAAGVYSVLCSFTGNDSDAIGEAPRAGLIFGPGGELFGTTSAGGLADTGSCFKITTTGLFTHLADFTTAVGWQPSGGPVLDTMGALLVPLAAGGTTGDGTLLKVTTSGAVTIAATIGGSFGEKPAGALLRVGNSWLGLAEAGGLAGRGELFRYNPAEGITPLADFASSSGSVPEGPATKGADGLYYVAAREGGAFGRGAILRFDATNGNRTTVASFSGTSGFSRGTRPRAPLALGPDGFIYGVTEAGGNNDQGTVFRVTPNGEVVTLVDFAASPQPNTPKSGLTLSPDGKFYATTSTGGANGKGTLFSVTTDGVYTTVFSFSGSSGTAPGDGPTGSLLAAPDGTLYGTTVALAGTTGSGTIYRVSAAGVPLTLGTFTGSSGALVGGRPFGQLAFGLDGCLYGCTSEEGSRGGGTLFRVKQLGPHVGTDAPSFFPGIVTLRGQVQTGGEATSSFFEYGTTTAFGSTTSTVNFGPGNSPGSLSATLSGLTPGTTIYYRARGSNSNGASIGLTRSFVVPTPLNAWKLAYFGTTSVPETADTDVDGSCNLAEYALVKIPTIADAASPALPVLRDYAEGRRLSLTVARDPMRADITVEVQAASDITGPWTTVASSVLGAPFSGAGYVSGDSATAGIKSVQIRDVVNVAASSSRYMRVRVSH